MLSDSTGKPPDSAADYPNTVVDWLETFDSATGLYDQAFVESVIDSLDFGWPNPIEKPRPLRSIPKSGEPPEDKKEWDWYCIDGGSEQIVYRMIAKLDSKPELRKRVTRIAHKIDGTMAVDVAGESNPRSYSQVICTMPLGCLSTVDVSTCELLYSQRMAIRMLHYDASTKVALKFQKRWWEDPDVMDKGAISGGQSSSDFPIRTCVYPSYGIGVPGAPGVLLASYTWAQDALRVGSLAQGKDTPADLHLRDITLDNVARLHGVSKEKMGPVVDHFAHSWYNDEHSRGAFALFGPGQFGTPEERDGNGGTEPKKSLFASLKAPAARGKLHIANEATSMHHAWVLGSLNSAWRAVYNALQGKPDARKKLIDNWGIPDEETEVHLQSLALLAKHRQL
jgi:monoamine oxidase